MTEIPRPLSPILRFVLTYDAWNRLTEVRATTGSLIAAYEYDGLGQRIQKIVGSNTFDYYYNDKWQVLTEAKNGVAEAIYAWHHYYIDALAVRFRANDQHYFLHDANFNVTAAYDVNPSSGTYRQVVERYRYTPYGQAIILDANFAVGAANGTISDIDNVYLYTGRERDPETGLQLNRHRYYHAVLGRWLTQDPIGYIGSPFNLYEYASSGPILHVDPTGENPLVIKICIGLIGGCIKFIVRRYVRKAQPTPVPQNQPMPVVQPPHNACKLIQEGANFRIWECLDKAGRPFIEVQKIPVIPGHPVPPAPAPPLAGCPPGVPPFPPPPPPPPAGGAAPG